MDYEESWGLINYSYDSNISNSPPQFQCLCFDLQNMAAREPTNPIFYDTVMDTSFGPFGLGFSFRNLRCKSRPGSPRDCNSCLPSTQVRRCKWIGKLVNTCLPNDDSRLLCSRY